MKKIVMLAVAMALATVPAYAGFISDNASSTEYGTKAPGMLLRGVLSAATSGVDILEHGYLGTRDGKPLIGTLEGSGRGTYFGLDRAVRGTVDVLGFLVPDFNGYPSTHEHEIDVLNF